MKRDRISHSDTGGVGKTGLRNDQISPAFQARVNSEGGRYTARPDFVSFVSLATSSAHVDGVRFVMVTGVGGRPGYGRGGELLVHERSRENEKRD